MSVAKGAVREAVQAVLSSEEWPHEWVDAEAVVKWLGPHDDDGGYWSVGAVSEVLAELAVDGELEHVAPAIDWATSGDIHLSSLRYVPVAREGAENG